MYDALTTFGVKLWNPIIENWCEVSVQGNCFSIREGLNRAGSMLPQPFTNELYDGSVIDLQGVLLYFQSPTTVLQRMAVSLKILLYDS